MGERKPEMKLGDRVVSRAHGTLRGCPEWREGTVRQISPDGRSLALDLEEPLSGFDVVDGPAVPQSVLMLIDKGDGYKDVMSGQPFEVELAEIPEPEFECQVCGRAYWDEDDLNICQRCERLFCVYCQTGDPFLCEDCWTAVDDWVMPTDNVQ